MSTQQTIESAGPSSDDLHLEHHIFLFDGNLRAVLPSEAEASVPKCIDTLLNVLKMEVLGPLEIFPAADLRAPGFSFIQPITTSHISGHYFEKPGEFPHLHIDIYSCKPFDWHEVIPVLDRFFALAKWSGNVIRRDIGKGREYFELEGEGLRCSQMPLKRA